MRYQRSAFLSRLPVLYSVRSSRPPEDQILRCWIAAIHIQISVGS